MDADKHMRERTHVDLCLLKKHRSKEEKISCVVVKCTSAHLYFSLLSRPLTSSRCLSHSKDPNAPHCFHFNSWNTIIAHCSCKLFSTFGLEVKMESKKSVGSWWHVFFYQHTVLVYSWAQIKDWVDEKVELKESVGSRWHVTMGGEK